MIPLIGFESFSDLVEAAAVKYKLPFTDSMKRTLAYVDVLKKGRDVTEAFPHTGTGPFPLSVLNTAIDRNSSVTVLNSGIFWNLEEFLDFLILSRVYKVGFEKAYYGGISAYRVLRFLRCCGFTTMGDEDKLRRVDHWSIEYRKISEEVREYMRGLVTSAFEWCVINQEDCDFRFKRFVYTVKSVIMGGDFGVDIVTWTPLWRDDRFKVRLKKPRGYTKRLHVFLKEVQYGVSGLHADS